MTALRGMRRRLAHHLQGFGSLAAATVIVLSVCGVAVATMAVAPIPEDALVARLFRAAPSTEGTIGRDLLIPANGLTKPVTLSAEINVHAWQNRDRRVLDFTVRDCQVIDGQAGDVALPSGSSAVQVLMQALTGRRVLGGAVTEAAQVMPKSGRATVQLVVIPNGETAALVIDRVLAPLPSQTAEVQPTVSPAQTVSPGASTPAPVVSGLSAYWGEPGVSITIQGTGFGASQAQSWVVCSGTKAQVVSWSDSAVTFVVPAQAIRAGYVGVVMGSVTSNGLYFAPYRRPALASLDTRESAPGSIVTLRGDGFGDSPENGWVSFAGSAADIVSWSDDEIRAIVPAGARPGYVGVVRDGMSSNGLLFGPHGLPFVKTVSSRRLTQGDSITIEGRDFGSKPGKVSLGGALISVTSWSEDRITFVVPSAKSGYLGVVTENGFSSNGVWANIVPRVTSVSRWWAAPGSSIDINGVGFGNDSAGYLVWVGGKVAKPTFWSNRRITVIVPADAVTGYVGVGTPAACSNGVSLVVETRAAIANVTPRTIRPGDTVVVTGSDFGDAGSGARLLIGGSHELSVTEWSDGRIVGRVPAGATSGYLGVNKQNVYSNGVWLTVAP